MKYCPTCNRSFTDNSLSFCIHDGTVLVRDDVSSSLESQPTAILGEPPPTVMMPPPRATEYVPRASPDAPTPPQPYGWANETPPAWVPPAPTPVPFSPVAAKQQTLAIVSLIFGLAGITFGWICGGPLFGLIAVVLGLVALMQIKKNPAQYGGKPLALAGLITGGLVLLINVAIIAIWIVMLIIGAASN